jgi:hypothetical protein
MPDSAMRVDVEKRRRMGNNENEPALMTDDAKPGMNEFRPAHTRTSAPYGGACFSYEQKTSRGKRAEIVLALTELIQFAHALEHQIVEADIQ